MTVPTVRLATRRQQCTPKPGARCTQGAGGDAGRGDLLSGMTQTAAACGQEPASELCTAEGSRGCRRTRRPAHEARREPEARSRSRRWGEEMVAMACRRPRCRGWRREAGWTEKGRVYVLAGGGQRAAVRLELPDILCGEAFYSAIKGRVGSPRASRLSGTTRLHQNSPRKLQTCDHNYITRG